jgi:hypothetical protein
VRAGVASQETNREGASLCISGSFDLDKCSFRCADEIGNGIVQDDEGEFSPARTPPPFNAHNINFI